VVAKNDITGDSLKSRPATKKYADNWDRIFGKKDTMWEHYCKHNGHFRVGSGESCSWCGEKEDGSLD
jgi:hypothetical protein